MWTGIGIQALQQLTGIVSRAAESCNRLELTSASRSSQNFIFYYGTSFFKNSGIQDPFIITIATK